MSVKGAFLPQQVEVGKRGDGGGGGGGVDAVAKGVATSDYCGRGRIREIIIIITPALPTPACLRISAAPSPVAASFHMTDVPIVSSIIRV